MITITYLLYYKQVFFCGHLGIIMFILDGRKMRLRRFKGVMQDPQLRDADPGLLLTSNIFPSHLMEKMSSQAGGPNPQRPQPKLVQVHTPERLSTLFHTGTDVMELLKQVIKLTAF